MSQTSRPAAASVTLRPAIVGECVGLQVVAAFPQAVYLAAETGDPLPGGPPVITLARPGAVIAPNAVIVTEPLAIAAGRADADVRAAGRSVAGGAARSPEPWPTERARAYVGDGRLVVGELTLRVTRWWSPVPRLTPPSRAVLATRADELAAALGGVAAAPDPDLDAELARRLGAFVQAIHLGDVAAAVRLGRRLVGFGPGLTPAGDDLLSGLLVACCWLSEGSGSGSAEGGLPTGSTDGRGTSSRHIPGDRAPSVRPTSVRLLDDVGRQLVEHARQATTTVSHALLWHAARGEVAGPVRKVLRALAGHGDIREQLPELLAVGSTSGRALALGLLAGARLAMVSPHEQDGPEAPLLGSDEPAMAGGGGTSG